jgi:LPXTG-motif cell wall-anchored protein
MKLFNKKAERRVWIALLASTPFVFFVVWIQTGEIGITEIIIVMITLLIGIGILYLTKWYSNKD